MSGRLMAGWQQRAILLKAMSFAAIGLVNTAVDFSVFSLAYYGLGIRIIPANLLAWSFAISGSYVMNSLTTFAHESGRQLRVKSYFKFALSQVGGLTANTLTVLIASQFIPVLAAKVLAIGASFTVNFSLSYFVVFRRRGPVEAKARR
jgi:putative flippase GtrA